MKSLKYFSVFFLVLFGIQFSVANPLMSFFFNELFQETGNPYGWKLELTETAEYSEHYYLTTLTDTAAFKPGLAYQTFKIITGDSLQKPLYINPAGDVLRIYSESGNNFLDELRFGNVDHTMILAPKPGTSICLCDSITSDMGEDYQEYYRYFTNSPTLHAPNNTTRAKGYIQGIVLDEQDQPLEGVKIIAEDTQNMYQYYSNTEAHTDASGQFTLFNLARLDKLSFSKEGYQTTLLTQQIWPDSTVVLEDPVQLNFVNAVANKKTLAHIRDYRLSQNFPNPFNAQTTFRYALPYGDFVEINVYDLSGKLVKNLFRGYKKRGRYQISWDAGNQASGFYIYQMRTSEKLINRKCFLIK